MMEHETGQRGTDEAFVKLMTLSGDAILKLLGMDAQTAATYHFRATVLKQKKLSPDIEGWSLISSNQPRAMLEFQGYDEPFIRHQLMAKVFMSCAQYSYNGPVLAGIIYTDDAHKQAALPLEALKKQAECQFGDCFVELVLTDFSEEQLKAIDPRLLILVPFTLKANIGPEELPRKGRTWQEAVENHFPEEAQHKALEIMGLFALARFRKISVKEIIQMLNLDMKSINTRLYNEGMQDGEQKGRQEGESAALLKLIRRKFGQVPDEITEKVTSAKLELIDAWLENILFANSLDDVFAS